VSASPAQAPASSTPYLDRLLPFPAPAKPSVWRQVYCVVFVISVGYVVPWLIIFGHGSFEVAARQWFWANIKEIFSDELGGVRFILTGFAVALAYLASIAVHEFGHFFAGRAAGFRFQSMQIGRFHIDQSFHVTRTPPSNEERLGEVKFFPEGMENRPWHYAFMTLAGSLANLLAGLLFLVLPFHKSFVSGSFIGVCLFLGFLNLTPLAADGKRLLAILFRRDDHEGFIALEQAYELMKAGKGFEELPIELITRATKLREKSARTYLAYRFSYGAAFERRDYEAAGASLEKCFALSPWAPNSMRQSMIYSAAIVQAKRGRIDSAEQWFSEFPEKLGQKYRLQIEGAIMEARGNFDGTLAKIAECKELLSKEPDGQSRDYFYKSMEKWKAELSQRSSPDSP
jgi:peptidase M50-like protein